MSGIRNLKTLAPEDVKEKDIIEIIETARVKNRDKYNVLEKVAILLHNCTIQWSNQQFKKKSGIGVHTPIVWQGFWLNNWSGLVIYRTLDLTLIEADHEYRNKPLDKSLIETGRQIEETAYASNSKYDTRKAKEEILIKMIDMTSQERIARIQNLILIQEKEYWTTFCGKRWEEIAK